MAWKKKHRSHHKKKIPVFATGGVIVQGLRIYSDYNAGPTGKKMSSVMTNMGIVAGKPFQPTTFLGYWSPVFIGVLTSATASKFGLNKYMAKVPVVNF